MYHQPSTSTFKYVSLDLSHLNKKKKSARQALLQSEISYGQDFNIQNSWVHGSGIGGGGGKTDSLKESMLSYTKRMNDIRRIRGINTLRHSHPSENTPALWINTGKGSLHFDMVEDNARSKYYSSQNRLSKSLGMIKLEPLLGSQKVSDDIDLDSNISLQTHKMEKETRLLTIPTESEEVPVKVKHITVTITIPPPEAQEDEGEMTPPSPQSPNMPVVAEVEPVKKKLIPLGGGKPRPRKAKRMKIIEPGLESINEDMEEPSLAHTQAMEEGYNTLLNDVHSSHELMLEQKKRTVALLRQTNYAQRSRKQTRQIAMATLAKRKLKKLPPIPTGRPTEKSSNTPREKLINRQADMPMSTPRNSPTEVPSPIKTPSFRYTNRKGGMTTSPYIEDRIYDFSKSENEY